VPSATQKFPAEPSSCVAISVMETAVNPVATLVSPETAETPVKIGSSLTGVKTTWKSLVVGVVPSVTVT